MPSTVRVVIVSKWLEMLIDFKQLINEMSRQGC